MSDQDTIATDETEHLISSTKVEGTKVYNPRGDALGTIQNFMVNKRTGRADYAVLEFGSFLGMGAEHYPIPWSRLAYDTDKGGYVVDLDRTRLENAPHYSANTPPAFNDAYGRSVYDYWDVPYPIV